MTFANADMVPTKIMGILNLTSNSMGLDGLGDDLAATMTRLAMHVEEGATIIDIGAEATNPASQPLNPEAEWLRLQPILQEIYRSSDRPYQVSIDTRNASTMLQALRFGVDCINNIAGLTDDETLRAIQKSGASYIAMHMHGTPQTMQLNPLLGSAAVASIDACFREWHGHLLRLGFAPQKVWLDPGIGFGKDDAANLQLLAQNGKWAEKYQIVAGLSRKSMFGRLLDLPAGPARDPATKMTEWSQAVMGVQMIRTHNVGPLARLLRLSKNYPSP